MKITDVHLKHNKYQSVIGFNLGFLLLLIVNSTISTFAQETDSDTISRLNTEEILTTKSKSFRITTLTFGGNGVYFTKVNNKFSVLTGGRGSATFNNRYTIGGGGWGMPKGIEVESETTGTYNFVKMGYGGIEVGYILYPGKRLNFGTNLLLAGGAVFKETVPESKNNEFKMFPVLEPSLYCQIKFSKIFHFEMGATYRYINGTNLPYISNNQMSGFSCYVGFLVSTCACK